MSPSPNQQTGGLLGNTEWSFVPSEDAPSQNAAEYRDAFGYASVGQTVSITSPDGGTTGTIPDGGVTVRFSFVGSGLSGFMKTLRNKLANVPVIQLPALPAGAGNPVLHFRRGVNDWQPVPGQVYRDGAITAHLIQLGYYQVFAPILTQPFAFGEVYVFPNPVRPGEVPTLHIEVGQADKVSYRLYDVAGDLVYEGKVDVGPMVVEKKPAYEERLDVKKFKSGAYFGVVTAEKAGKDTVRKKFRFTVIK